MTSTVSSAVSSRYDAYQTTVNKGKGSGGASTQAAADKAVS